MSNVTTKKRTNKKKRRTAVSSSESSSLAQAPVIPQKMKMRIWLQLKKMLMLKCPQLSDSAKQKPKKVH